MTGPPVRLPVSGDRPLLLASLADPGEAAAAVAGGADILDLKDPRRGPLGACEPAAVRALASWLAARAGAPAAGGAALPLPPISAALGDARDGGRSAPRSLPRLAAALAGAGAAILKLGLAGAPDPGGAAGLLLAVARAARAARPGTLIVAVSYGDAFRAGAPEPGALPAIAAAAGADGCLLDTFHKDGGTLVDRLAAEDLRGFVLACRAAGLCSALAGSLGPGQLPRIAAAAPQIVGARGALCEGGRAGRLVADRVRRFRAALDAAALAATAVPPTPARAAHRASDPRL
jgi:hypothetical protein